MVNARMVKGTNKKCYTRKGVTHSGEIEGTSALVRSVGPMSFLVPSFGSIITKARPKELQMYCHNTLRKASLLVISTFSSNRISFLRLIYLFTKCSSMERMFSISYAKLFSNSQA